VLGQEVARRERGATHAIDAALGAAALFAVLGLGEAAIGWVGGAGWPAIGSAVGGPELLALHLTLLAPPGLALAALGRDAAFATRILVILAGLALALTGSRAGWAGGYAAILGMGLLACKLTAPGRRRLLGLALGLLGIGLLGAALLSIPGSPLAGHGDLVHRLSPAALIDARRADWGAGIAAMKAHPWFGQLAAPNPYNLFLGLGAGSGALAPLLFLGVLVAAGRSGFRAVRDGRATAPEAIGCFGAALGLLVTGIGEASLGARLTPPAFLVLGLWCGLGDLPRTRERSA
jgi:O-antigen ligase